MKIAVTDASIFIDLIHIGWVRHLSRLDGEVVTTYEVLAELHGWQQALLEELVQEQGLAIHPVRDSDLSSWKETVATARGLSRPDLTVLWLAVQLEAMVLTGDKVMRSTSTRLNLETHGILWLFEQFIENQLVSHSEACNGLEALMEINDRLPREECAKRLDGWRT